MYISILVANLSWSHVWCFLLLLLRVTTANNDIFKINYGVKFERIGKMSVAQQYWRHTFQVLIPTMRQAPQLAEQIRCPTVAPSSHLQEMCKEISNMYGHIDQLTDNMHQRLTVLDNSIKMLIPDTNKTVNKQWSKGKRTALLPFIGDLSHSLFGTATEKDLDVLRRHMNNMVSVEKKFIEAFHSESDSMHSYMTANTQQINNILTTVHLNHDSLVTLHNEMEHSLNQVVKTFSTLMHILINQTTALNFLSHQLDNFFHGIEKLQNGQLSPFLIPPHVLQTCLDEVHQKLVQRFPSFHVAFHHIRDFYDMEFIYLRHGNSIFVTLKIPITPQAHKFSLFRITTFPIPLHNASTQATQLLDVTPFLAVSTDTKFFMEMDDATVDSCKGSHVKQCPNAHYITSSDFPTCSIALLFEQTSSVKTLCNFKYLHYHIPSFILPVSETTLLLSSISSVTYTCTNLPSRVEQGCNYCIIEVPCFCSITADSFIHPPRISNCVKDTQITKTYPVNLALLHSFFQESELQEILSHSTFSEPLHMSLPSFNVYEHNYSDLVDTSNKLQFSLQKVVNKAKQNGTIYNSLLESVLNGELSSQAIIPPTSFFQSTVIPANPIVVSVLSLSLTICLWFKNKKLALLVSDLTSNMSLHILLIALCSTILFVLIAKFCRFNYAKRAKLGLDIMSDCNTVHLDVLNIDLPPVHYTFAATEPIAQLTVSHLPCLIFLSWNRTIVVNNVTKCTVTLPSKLLVSIATWIKLRLILKQSYNVVLCHQFKGYYDLAEVKVIANDDVQGTLIKDSETAKLYPVINNIPASAPTYP